VPVNHAAQYLAEIPSPTQGAWHLGPFPIRAYALCILLGIVAACVITEVRLRRRGAPPWMVLDVAVWAVPFGILGARIYHVITSPDAYFGAGGRPLQAFAIWNGGLGIWGGVAGGALGAWFACRRLGVPLTFVADAVAPGLPVAQAIGRLGNWFNNELYGGHTDLPWGLQIYRYDLRTGQAETDANGDPIEVPGGPFHPAFLYELVWNLGVALLVWLVDRKWKLGKGRAFALYVMAYTVGRFWIEAIRTDEAHVFVGMRVNNWVSILVFLGALAYFVRVRGPQEHVKVDENGRLLLVTADGEPIEWRGRIPALAVDTDTGPEAGVDTGPEAGVDTGPEAAVDTGPEAGTDHAEPSVDEGAEDSAPVEKK
jgi:prolipoprotein diacylglyceryl transferase